MPDASLSAVAGLVIFNIFLRAIGVDRPLRDLFGDLKSRVLGTSIGPTTKPSRLCPR